MVVSPTGSNVDFVGTNYSGEATAGQQCRYAVGVFDKEAQTLKIVPVACDKVNEFCFFFFLFLFFTVAR